jgi:ATP-binding cassette subfamily B protein
MDVGRVLVVESGRVVADGSHTELLESSSFYRELVETQLVSE